jgi:hypothetical protein
MHTQWRVGFKVKVLSFETCFGNGDKDVHLIPPLRMHKHCDQLGWLGEHRNPSRQSLLNTTEEIEELKYIII